MFLDFTYCDSSYIKYMLLSLQFARKINAQLINSFERVSMTMPLLLIKTGQISLSMCLTTTSSADPWLFSKSLDCICRGETWVWRDISYSQMVWVCRSLTPFSLTRRINPEQFVIITIFATANSGWLPLIAVEDTISIYTEMFNYPFNGT